MKSAHFLLLLLPLLAACAAKVPTYVWKPFTNPPPAPDYTPLKSIRVSGFVLDAASRKPVRGVWVKSEKSSNSRWSRTDSSGHFMLLLPPGRREAAGGLVVQTIFYDGKAAIPVDSTQSVIILLKRNAYQAKPYGCQQPTDSVRISPYSYMPLGLPGSQFAFLIRDSLLRQPCKLRTITFTTGHKAFPQERFRFRIYQGSKNPEAPPGGDLLLENLEFVPSSEEGVWTYDVSPYDIMVSGTDFFIAFEYLMGDIHGGDGPLMGYTPTGPVLRPPCARADIRTWEYKIGKGWRRATNVENFWPLYESAISVEVEPAPTPPTKP